MSTLKEEIADLRQLVEDGLTKKERLPELLKELIASKRSPTAVPFSSPTEDSLSDSHRAARELITTTVKKKKTRSRDNNSPETVLLRDKVIIIGSYHQLN